MSESEWDSKKDATVVEITDVHTDDELKRFMCDQETVREDLDTVQYKFMLIPKFRDGKGAMIVKTHHCFTDGIGYSTFFLALSGEFDASALPAFKPLGFFKQLIIYMLMPLLLLKATWNILSISAPYNAIKKDMKFTGKKNGAFTNDINVDEIKALCKAKGCTINDYMMATISTVMYEYFDNRKADWKGVIPDSISIAMPFSLRPPAASLKDIKMVNNFVTYPVNMPIRKEIGEVLPTMQAFFKGLRTSLMPFGAI